jgi:hypothetical protein
MLQEIFDLERAWREGPDEDAEDSDEQIYVAAFLLFLIGDPADSGRLYDAKFRTGESIFGAGRRETLEWLLEHGHTEEHAHLSEWLESEDPKIEDWARDVRQYFYSSDGVLLLEAPPL